VKEVENIFKNKVELRERFLDIFESCSWNNRMFGALSFHTLLGQMLKDLRVPKGGLYLDPRISAFIIQDSGSGKSTAYEIFMRFVKGLGYTNVLIDEPNDADLIGTQETEQKKEGGVTKTVYTEKPGCLSWADFVLVDEGIVLINRKKHGGNALVYFQKALNPIGSESNKIEKRMAHGDPIELQPHCSLLITSIMPPGLNEVVLNTGFMQRILVFPRWLTDKDRLDNAMRDVDNLGVSDTQIEEINNLLVYFEKIKNHYKNNVIVIPASIKPILKQKVITFFKIIEKANLSIKPLLMTFLSRYQNFMYILAVHYAAIRLDNIVIKEDLDNAYDIIFNIFNEIVFWLETSVQMSKGETKIRGYWLKVCEIFDDKISVGNMELQTHLKEILRVSKPTAIKYMKAFSERGYIIEEEGKYILAENVR